MIQKLLEEKVPQLLKKKGIGLTVGIMRNGKREIYAFGQMRHADSQAPDGRTLYEIGSVTKTFTAALLADMVAKGEIQLEQPIKDFLPEIPDFPQSVTLLSLATHTSGLPRLPKGIFKSVLKDVQNPYANYAMDDLMNALRSLREEDLKKHRGLVNYSNFGMGLLGNILAEQLGMSYEEAIIERICKPLGLQDTVAILSSEQETRLAEPFNAAGKKVKSLSIPALAGAGVLRSTVEDMLHYLCAYMSDSSPLYETLQSCLELRFTEASTNTDIIMRFLGFFSRIRKRLSHDEAPQSEFKGIGLGWHQFQFLDSETCIYGHDGGTVAYRSMAAFSVEQKIALVILNNQGFGDLDFLLPRYNFSDLLTDIMQSVFRD